MNDFFIEFFKTIGENPQREGLKNTPNRVIKSWEQLYRGYSQNPKDILQNTFSDGSCDEMVVLKDIEFQSMCEHHILPFFGTISLGYIPNKKLIGISKLVQVVEIFSRRLQIQENLTMQIADTLMEELKPQGVMVVAEATHLCMIMQGNKNKNAVLITSAVRGTFKKDARSRAEFMEHIK